MGDPLRLLLDDLVSPCEHRAIEQKHPQATRFPRRLRGGRLHREDAEAADDEPLTPPGHSLPVASRRVYCTLNDFVAADLPSSRISTL